MVEATDELRERLVRAVLRPHPKVELRPGEWVTDVGPVVDELAEVVAAVVAEARTEAIIIVAQSAIGFIQERDSGLAIDLDEHFAQHVGAPDRELLQRVAALRGVGNQNAEPRWSANRLEEVLREGLPDQNAEPEDKR